MTLGRLFRHACLTLQGAAIAFGMVAPAMAERPLKAVGVLVGDLANPFFREVGRGVESGVAKLGLSSVKVSVQSSGYDLERQIRQVDALVAEGYDLLILNAVDTIKVAPAVARARAAGRVVVAVDVNSDGADASVTSDNLKAGEIACNHIADRLDGKGDVLIINGPPVSAVIDRVEGCRAVLAKQPRIKLLTYDQNAGGSIAGGTTTMTSLLTLFPKIDAVFAINDPTAIGADRAARQAGRKEFFIVAVDGSPNAISVLSEADTRLIATVAQEPRIMAEEALRIGYAILQGGARPTSAILIPVSLVTRDTLSNFQGWSR